MTLMAVRSTDDSPLTPRIADPGPDPIDAAEALLADGVDPWDVLVTAGVKAQANMDQGRWLIGERGAAGTQEVRRGAAGAVRGQHPNVGG